MLNAYIDINLSLASKELYDLMCSNWIVSRFSLDLLQSFLASKELYVLTIPKPSTDVLQTSLASKELYDRMWSCRGHEDFPQIFSRVHQLLENPMIL